MPDTLTRLTNKDWVLHDPQIDAPPQGVDLLVVTEGGRLVTGPWRDEYVAWGHFPVLPTSVKARLRGVSA